MKCNCKLKEKLRIATELKRKYEDKCQRISKIIANREGKKLRLITWQYEGKTTMYITYQAELVMLYGIDKKMDVGFFSGGTLGFVPSNNDVERPWRDNGKKVSSDIVTYYDKQYRINNKFQVCEVLKTGLFKKVLHEIVVKDLREVLGVEDA